MDELSKNLKNYLLHCNSLLNNKDNLKKIVSHLNKKGIVILSGVIGTNKLGVLKDMIIKTKMEDNFFYYNTEVDIHNKVTSREDLEELYNDQKIIILENIDHIDFTEGFIHSKFKKGSKVILIGNALHIKGVEEIEILPERESYNENTSSLFVHKIITKDIYIKQKLKNFQLLEHTIRTLALNNKLISVREIHKILNEQGSKISQITLIEYINYIAHSKLIKKIFRYDLKTKNISTGKAKYLFTDTLLRNAVVSDLLKKHILSENDIFQKLEMQGHQILTGKNGTFDFSFITANKDRDNLIIHVSENLEKSEVKKEAKKLLKIPGDYTKYMIVDSIKEIGIRPSTYLPLNIMEIEDFLQSS